ncbi:MAG: TPM domain-containing protein [Acidobacteriaceae bacterium]|nr:TPM domain-containing protein [Acidobacteriaceae bacterium]
MIAYLCHKPRSFLASLVFLVPLLAAQDLSTLKPQGYVSDFANVLDAPSRAQAEAYCGRVEQATGVQIAIVTINSLDGQPVEDAANTLFRRWGVGKKGADEGLLLLLSIQDHKDRIEVGYGLEPTLPDGFVGSVLRSMRPALEQNNYGQAVLAGLETMGNRIASAKGVALDAMPGRRTRVPVRRQRHDSIPWPLIIFLIIFLFGLMNRGGRGGGGGFLTGMILGNVLGRSNRWRGGGGGFGGGGFGGYDGGGGGGGGGFGGFGGGDSGGGGASGSW